MQMKLRKKSNVDSVHAFHAKGLFDLLRRKWD